MNLNPFRRKRTYQPSEHSMRVLVIDDSAEELSAKLGMTPERYAELRDAIIAVLNKAEKEKSLDIAEAAATISKSCRHPNELALTCYLLGCFVEKQQQRSSFLMNLFNPNKP